MNIAELIAKRDYLRDQIRQIKDQNLRADRSEYFISTELLERQLADVEWLIRADDDDVLAMESEVRKRQAERLPKLEDTLVKIREYFGAKK